MSGARKRNRYDAVDSEGKKANRHHCHGPDGFRFATDRIYVFVNQFYMKSMNGCMNG